MSCSCFKLNFMDHILGFSVQTITLGFSEHGVKHRRAATLLGKF